jgi:hypothetical protein
MHPGDTGWLLTLGEGGQGPPLRSKPAVRESGPLFDAPARNRTWNLRIKSRRLEVWFGSVEPNPCG